MNIEHQTDEQDWGVLYKLGGLAAYAMAGITIAQFIAFIIVPPPYEGSVLEWFTFFQKSKLAGLVGFELLMVVYVLLSLVTTLALFILLRRVNPTYTVLYLAFSLVGVICFVQARPVFEMLSLSNDFAAATTDAQKAIHLSAGEILLADFHGTSFHVSYVLGSLSGLLISLVMLKTNAFSKTTAYLRIASSVFDFGLYVPVIGLFISLFSVLFLLAWSILVARRLLQLSH